MPTTEDTPRTRAVVRMYAANGQLLGAWPLNKVAVVDDTFDIFCKCSKRFPKTYYLYEVKCIGCGEYLRIERE